MRDEALRLINRHRRTGILIDANLLLLLVVGRFDQQRILTFERTSAFMIEDYRLLEVIVRQFSKILTTAHVLTEVSNLSTKLEKKLLFSFRDMFRQTIETVDERGCTAKDAAANRYFQRLGLTDAAILALTDRRFLLLTADAELALVASATGGDALNFNHLRPVAWEKTLS